MLNIVFVSFAMWCYQMHPQSMRNVSSMMLK